MSIDNESPPNEISPKIPSTIRSSVQKNLFDKVVSGKRFVHIVQMPRGGGFVKDFFTIDGAPVKEVDWNKELAAPLL